MSSTADSTNEQSVHFYQGLDHHKENPETLFKKKVKELCNVKHLNFLFGAGTSSGAIPPMKAIKEALDQAIGKDTSGLNELYDTLKQDNLEDILNVLYAQRFYQEGVGEDAAQTQKLISFIQGFMFKSINVAMDTEESKAALELYKIFYIKLALRNKDLSRINVFTTNNDLFNERALDHLNINYNNGFGGGLERYFNPARFRYTHSKRVDLNMEKFEPIDNMVYLYKLHGSINWVQSEENKGNALFGIQEIPLIGGIKTADQPALIYPTPLKQNQSLGSPYADLIREFKDKLTLQNSVLFVIGYSFSDEHLNNIIYQALASNTSMSVVIFGDHDKCLLSRIGDSRVYRFFGATEISEEQKTKVHYFEHIVKSLLPDVDDNRDKSLLENFVEQLENAKKENEHESR